MEHQIAWVEPCVPAGYINYVTLLRNSSHHNWGLCFLSFSFSLTPTPSLFFSGFHLYFIQGMVQRRNCLLIAQLTSKASHNSSVYHSTPGSLFLTDSTATLLCEVMARIVIQKYQVCQILYVIELLPWPKKLRQPHARGTGAWSVEHARA